MKWFQADIRSSTGEKPIARLSGAGLTCHIRGETTGCSVTITHNEDDNTDLVSVYRTNGKVNEGQTREEIAFWSERR